MTNNINTDGVNRLMTDDEQAEHDTWVAQHNKELAAEAKTQADKAKQRQIVLDRLGITADEAALLLS